MLTRTFHRIPLMRRSIASIASHSYEMIMPEARGPRVALITLNRPKALNALCDQLITELNDCTRKLDADPACRAIVITGSEKAFAAGADIKEMAEQGYINCYNSNMFSDWADLMKIQTPVIAAVNGYALGGGCELAMMCDILIAGDKAKFGQPEITLGTIPGCGGTQRLVKAVGKSKAMEIILGGGMLTAEEAQASGLASHVYPAAELVSEALKLATNIAKYSKPIAAMCKESVNASYELGLSEGLRFERRIFHSTFATQDQKIGMRAFMNKEKNPEFVDK